MKAERIWRRKIISSCTEEVQVWFTPVFLQHADSCQCNFLKFEDLRRFVKLLKDRPRDRQSVQEISGRKRLGGHFTHIELGQEKHKFVSFYSDLPIEPMLTYPASSLSSPSKISIPCSSTIPSSSRWMDRSFSRASLHATTVTVTPIFPTITFLLRITRISQALSSQDHRGLHLRRPPQLSKRRA